MDALQEMIDTLREMGDTYTYGIPQEVVTAYLDAHGIGMRFLIDQMPLIQTLNENPQILAQATKLAFPD